MTNVVTMPVAGELRVKLAPGTEEGCEVFEIEFGHPRAEWQVLTQVPEAGLTVITGYGGENHVTIHWMGMQDCTVDVVVTHSCVDNPIVTRHERVNNGVPLRKRNFDTVMHLTERAINQMIADIFKTT